MSDIRVEVGQENTIKSRVGEENTIKVLSSASGSAAKVKSGQENTIKSRVGQQNTVNILSSVSGSSGGTAVSAENVIGGIASVTSLYVSGASTFVGVSTFKNNVYIDGDLYVNDDIFFDEFTARNANITGILTVGQSIYYPLGQPYGVAYFDSNDQLVSTGTTSAAISETNYILTTDNSGIPTWSNVIDGGTY
jgi:hypothetical protein